MEVYGYKCFDKGLINRYGMKFEVGKTYEVKGAIKYGNDGNGFHMCEKLEDTLRYFDGMFDDIEICYVKGSEDVKTNYDKYNDYETFAVRKIEILKKLTREEIINQGLSILNEFRVIRFISGFKLTEEEISRFKEKFLNCEMVINLLDYYQHEYYSEKMNEREKKYGQYSNKRR